MRELPAQIPEFEAFVPEKQLPRNLALLLPCTRHLLLSAATHWRDRLSLCLRTLICSMALWVSACETPTTFTSTWKAPDAHRINGAGKKIAAVVLSSDVDRRRSAEVYLANDLTIRGARGVASYTLLGFDNRDANYARARLKEAGVEGVIVMRMVGKDQRTWGDPGGLSGSAYGSFGSYYSYGMELTYSTSSIQTETVVSIETLIYSLKDDKLLWASTSRTTNPDNLSQLVDQVADAVAREAAKQGLIAR